MFFVEGHEAKKLGVEVELDFADWPVAVLGEDELGDVGGDEVIVVLFVVVGAVEEHDKVGVLLDGAGFAEVGEDWAGVVAAGDATRKLSKSNNWDFEFASKCFEATGDFGDLLDAVAGVAIGTLEELEVVDDDHANIVVMGGAASFVAEFENGHGTGVVDIKWDFVHFAESIANPGEIFVGEIAGADFPGVDAGDIRNHAIDDFVVSHLH